MAVVGLRKLATASAIVAIALLSTTLGITSVFAQSASTSIPCAVRSAYDQMAAAFNVDPFGHFTALSNRGTSLALPTRNIVAYDPAALANVIELLEGFDPESDQEREVVIGLGQAALMSSDVSPLVALIIQEVIDALDNETINTGFLTITGGIETAALGPVGRPVDALIVNPAAIANQGEIAPFGSASDLTIHREPTYTFSRRGVTATVGGQMADVVSPIAP